jgi:HK97 family phage major capsid protein
MKAWQEARNSGALKNAINQRMARERLLTFLTRKEIIMKLHELKQKRNTIAADMRALHEKIGDTAWTDEQRTQWGAMKSELDALDAQIAREEELRRQDQTYIEDQEGEQRQQQGNHGDPQQQASERRRRV